ncbi:hypothetical protein SODALDRAFT_355974 [Sodiomyces alkalinus F11]|uniref:U1-type domain-containing protein n=1 Tax=Sodiomyces alkalinus (strain CBS 110278 / VKM F-3762 / F11) TaxID=1314773 RepID=A0A3N2QAH4_SODAK|nr:hypothetical protein SODALDRAFT_355974 [Sodiomyces alkalinus F11]ROT43751.1 hypothetical protein SODALDRAFT_355974 [Sodiomyces alkalinus F11]
MLEVILILHTSSFDFVGPANTTTTTTARPFGDNHPGLRVGAEVVLRPWRWEWTCIISTAPARTSNGEEQVGQGWRLGVSAGGCGLVFMLMMLMAVVVLFVKFKAFDISRKNPLPSVQESPTMSEYWKSTPRYWCKHCSVFVRDTKLERANHEATGKHQGALKRFMRDLHRNHEREERDKERAKREIERLNGVVSGTGSGSGSSSSRQNATASGSSSRPTPTAAELARQREELAQLGVAMPSVFRGEMAMPGEWTVTKTRVIQDDEGNAAAAAAGSGRNDAKVTAKATGVRKRVMTEEEKEAEEAAKALFKRQRRWGGTKTMPEDDAELEALLSGGGLLAAKKERTESEEPKVKKEEEEMGDGAEDTVPDVKAEEPEVKTETEVKKEPADEDGGVVGGSKAQVPPVPDAGVKTEEGAAETVAPVVFKKRKPKNSRQKVESPLLSKFLTSSTAYPYHMGMKSVCLVQNSTATSSTSAVSGKINV